MKTIILGLLFLLPLSVYAQQRSFSNINPKLHVFPELTFQENTSSDDPSLFDIRKNAVYNSDLLLFCYERIIPIKKNIGFTLTGGFIIWEPINIVGELGLLLGGLRHFGEIGLGYHLNPNDSDWNMGIIRFGYRYQSNKGFLLKASIAFNRQTYILPLIGLGYSF